MMTETGEKPHTCEVCKKSFSRKRNLKKHEITHTGEKPHTCEVCEKSFSSKEYLNKHKGRHTGEKPHTCEVCKKSFRLRENLNKHKGTHTGEKNFHCETCNKSFSRKDTLKSHTSSQNHLEKKHFSNNMRDNKFTREQYMNQHMSVHLKKDNNLSSLCGGIVLETFKHGITGQVSLNRNCESDAQNWKQNASFPVTISSPMNSISLSSKHDNRNWDLDESPLDLSKTGRKHSFFRR